MDSNFNMNDKDENQLSEQTPNEVEAQDPIQETEHGSCEEDGGQRGSRTKQTKEELQEQLNNENRVVAGGILEVLADGFGFLRGENYQSTENDIYIAPAQIKRFHLKTGDHVVGIVREPRYGERYRAIIYINEINGLGATNAIRRKDFDRLVPVYPVEKLTLETERDNLAPRIIDLLSPIGKGQRGLIVAPPRAGKTSVLKNIANSIRKNNPEVVLMILLVDERPEEVTDIRESVDCDVIASTFDQDPSNHIKVTEMVLARAKALVEMDQDVVILMDSITRLARAYNLTINPTGRSLSGGLDPGALYGPKSFFGAARNTKDKGSLTIIATALVDTGSRMDEIIFEEFKGTGNMEIVLDRRLAERRIYPAIDIFKSATRKEELLLSDEELEAAVGLRRSFGQKQVLEVMEDLISLLKNTRSNKEFIEVAKKTIIK